MIGKIGGQKARFDTKRDEPVHELHEYTYAQCDAEALNESSIFFDP